MRRTSGRVPQSGIKLNETFNHSVKFKLEAPAIIVAHSSLTATNATVPSRAQILFASCALEVVTDQIVTILRLAKLSDVEELCARGFKRGDRARFAPCSSATCYPPRNVLEY